jgi:hypothetical protein
MSQHPNQEGKGTLKGKKNPRKGHLKIKKIPNECKNFFYLKNQSNVLFIKYILEEERLEEHFHCHESYLLYALKSGHLNKFYKEVSCPSNCCCPSGIS